MYPDNSKQGSSAVSAHVCSSVHLNTSQAHISVVLAPLSGHMSSVLIYQRWLLINVTVGAVFSVTEQLECRGIL